MIGQEVRWNTFLGDNDAGTAYVVGYNENAVKYPHHRAPSGLTMAEDTREQKACAFTVHW